VGVVTPEKTAGSREDRHRHILETLRATRKVDVAELAESLGVSTMTIRRDLAELDDSGLLDRVHGGAVTRRAPAYGSRASAMSDEKAAIARAVADLVPPGASIGLDTGTTCHAVAEVLAERDDLTVVTNSLHAAIEFRDSGSRVIVLGGMLTPELSLVSGTAVQEPPAVHLDLLVLGCGGIALDPGITHFDPREVDVRRMLSRQADTVIIAADHTKFGRRMAMVMGPLDLIDILVTDQAPPEDLHRALTDRGAKVVTPVRSAPSS
jgi:DeoR/GlpR family transcriptional regulator of sugar metabolism